MKTRITKIRKSDCVFFGIILILAALIFAMQIMTGSKNAAYVIVRVDGELTASYDLTVDQEISLNGGTNILLIEGGKASMIEADCPDKLCVRQRAISRERESIICLPNKVVVEVAGSSGSMDEPEDKSELDAVTN
ncbi:MAG: NusG domain II-containing protein [Coprococcus sp.]|nr:NusG domain II-containing protein [Coprococcus sp.]